MENVQIVAYHENCFSVMPDANDESLRNKEVAVGINPLLRYKEGTNAVGCQLRVEYSVDGKTLMEYSAVLTVMMDGWAGFLKKDTDDSAKIAATREAWRAVLGFVRGAICANATNHRNTLVARMILPVVNLDNFMQTVSISKVE